MKKIWLILLSAAVLAGIIVVSCKHDEDAETAVDFVTFEGDILDNNYWMAINTPGVMGIGDQAPLCVGRNDYTNQEVYPGEVYWSLSATGVVIFVPTSKSETNADGDWAKGSIVGLRAVAEGEVTVVAEDDFGHRLEHTFKVGEGQHYRPDGEWKDGGDDDPPHGSSSSSDEPHSSSGSSSAYDSSSSAAQKSSSSSSSAYKSSSSSAQKSSSSYESSSSSAQRSSSASEVKMR